MLIAILGNLRLTEGHRPWWGGRVRKQQIPTPFPDILRPPEENMREQKMTSRERRMEEAFYLEA